ncbi:MAG: glycosyltransferase [Eubacteriales bacterium]
MKRTVIVIPALDPNERICILVGDLVKAGFSNIVIVDDGSMEDNKKYFEILKANYGCRILKHAVNMGKGRALKTAFNYVLNEFPDTAGVVTADCDGQHTVEDIIKCSNELEQNPSSLIMGVRDFSKDNVPFRSRFGNIATVYAMRFFCGIRLSDTQTGLRGIPIEFMSHLLNVSGERFEFETHMLIATRDYGVKITEVPISTVYINNNSSSHFRPLTDSLKIYSIFLYFIAASLISFIVDIGVFSLTLPLFFGLTGVYYIWFATGFARVVSSAVNYAINQRRTFKNRAKVRDSMPKYFTLCLVQMAASAGLVSLFHSALGGSETFIKIIIDTLLFFVSFQIQRAWVFKKNSKVD